MSQQQIAVLISAGRHPISGQARYHRNDALALTLGLALCKTLHAAIEVLHAGRADEPALPQYLALGASEIHVLPCPRETDVVDTLAANLANSDLILTGSRAESGQDSGMLPYLLAQKLNRPLVNNALDIQPAADGVEVLQFLPKGKRRRVRVQLPAIIAIHPLAPVELRYAYARQVSGSINTRDSAWPDASSQPSGIAQSASGTAQSDSRVRDAVRKPHKLKARDNKAGHARMLAAIVSEAKDGTVVNEGTSVEKAQVIVAYLREHHLSNF